MRGVLDRFDVGDGRGLAGSPSCVMIMRAALPSGDMNNFRPRLKSGLVKTSGGK